MKTLNSKFQKCKREDRFNIITSTLKLRFQTDRKFLSKVRNRRHNRLLGSRDLHYCHIDSYCPNSVSTETPFKFY
jgi:hypothetical protein